MTHVRSTGSVNAMPRETGLEHYLRVQRLESWCAGMMAVAAWVAGFIGVLVYGTWLAREHFGHLAVFNWIFVFASGLCVVVAVFLAWIGTLKKLPSWASVQDDPFNPGSHA